MRFRHLLWQICVLLLFYHFASILEVDRRERKREGGVCGVINKQKIHADRFFFLSIIVEAGGNEIVIIIIINQHGEEKSLQGDYERVFLNWNQTVCRLHG